jgi:hypothetical protein
MLTPVPKLQFAWEDGTAICDKLQAECRVELRAGLKGDIGPPIGRSLGSGRPRPLLPPIPGTRMTV